MEYLYNDNRLKEFRKKFRNDPTKSEVVLWSKLQRSQLGVKFRRQFSFDKYILDFYAAEFKLNIEVDGITHEDPVNISRDEFRDKYLTSHGITVMRFSAAECFNRIEQVTEEIYNKVQELRGGEIPPPTHSLKEGRIGRGSLYSPPNPS